jgi:ribonuclease HIII
VNHATWKLKRPAHWSSAILTHLKTSIDALIIDLQTEDYCLWSARLKVNAQTSKALGTVKLYTSGSLLASTGDTALLAHLVDCLGGSGVAWRGELTDKDVPTSAKPSHQPTAAAVPVLPVLRVAPQTETQLGTDEAGKGDYFGPLVVAGCIVPPHLAATLQADGVQDSKNLNDKQIFRLQQAILNTLPPYAIEVLAIDPPTYNARIDALKAQGQTLNNLMAEAHCAVIWRLLTQATRHGGAEALPGVVIVDQFSQKAGFLNRYYQQALKTAGVGVVRLMETPKAESISLAVAAASILARATYLTALSAIGEKLGRPIHAGAGNPTLEDARWVVREHGPDMLKQVAKWRFKTTDTVMQTLHTGRRG